MAIQNRRGYEADFDPAKMLPGEWAVSLDTKYVRMCFAPGECLRMATYEGFEQDMEEVRRILAECRDIRTAVELIRDNVTEAELVIEDYVAQAKQYRDEAEQFKNEAFATTPDGYTDLVQNVADNTVKIDTVIEKAELNIKNTATGETIHITDSADSKVLEFGLHGKAEQNGTPTLDAQADIEVAGARGSIEVKSVGKNELAYPYQDSSKTVGGIKFTDLGDGRIKAVGTSTERVSFTIHGRNTGETNDFSLLNGSYIFSGCPVGGSATTYRVNFGITQDGAYKELGSDRGSGYAFTANGDDFSEDSVNMGIAIDIMAGQTIDLIFEPMIRLASIEDDTWEPFKSTTSLISTPEGFPGIPVDSGGNYTDENGQEWISNSIYKYTDGSGKRFQRVKSYSLKVSEMNALENYPGWVVEDLQGVVGSINKHMQTTLNIGTMIGINTVSYSNLFLPMGYYGLTQTEWKTQYPDLVVNVLVPYAEPIITDLTAEEIAEIEKLHTFYPVTNISNDANCGMYMKYLCDSKNYIDNKFALIEAAMVNNI